MYILNLIVIFMSIPYVWALIFYNQNISLTQNWKFSDVKHKIYFLSKRDWINLEEF